MTIKFTREVVSCLSPTHPDVIFNYDVNRNIDCDVNCDVSRDENCDISCDITNKGPIVFKQQELFDACQRLKCGLSVRVEVQKKGQCHHCCQKYGYAHSYCAASPKCLKCAQDHMTHLCPLTGQEETLRNPGDHLTFSNYDVICADRLNGRGGGLAALIKRGIDHHRSTNAEMQTIEAASVVVDMAGGIPLKV
ncbi:unnamed protein product [Callosobruchus maculatus]|uniref:Uncharacterized protein n=1 Tax=Callosobruchus maculatus TaxID=64391 RepID=A0A653BZX5_CALMS|nr:unnamed protein product [Callosobruchus maculatus]